MGNNQKYSIDFKLQVVGKYEQGKCGYKRLAREFNEPTEKVPQMNKFTNTTRIIRI